MGYNNMANFLPSRCPIHRGSFYLLYGQSLYPCKICHQRKRRDIPDAVNQDQRFDCDFIVMEFLPVIKSSDPTVLMLEVNSMLLPVPEVFLKVYFAERSSFRRFHQVTMSLHQQVQIFLDVVLLHR